MASTKKSRTAKLTGNGGEPDKPNGRHWTQWIEPKAVKNHGRNNVMLMAQHGDLMGLSPGAVRATYARGTITVESRGENPALIGFEFIPIFITP